MRIWYLERRDNTAAPWVHKQTVKTPGNKEIRTKSVEKENAQLGWEQWRWIEYKGE